MDVHGISSVGSSLPVSHTRLSGDVRTEAASAPAVAKDEVTISEAGKALEASSKPTSLREARLAQIKSAIDAGTYDTDEKMELALSRMFERIGISTGL